MITGIIILVNSLLFNKFPEWLPMGRPLQFLRLAAPAHSSFTGQAWQTLKERAICRPSLDTAHDLCLCSFVPIGNGGFRTRGRFKYQFQHGTEIDLCNKLTLSLMPFNFKKQFKQRQYPLINKIAVLSKFLG